MRRPAAPPRDSGDDEIDAWVAWFRQAQRDTIDAHVDMSPDARAKALASAEALADAVGDRMRSDYQHRKATAPR